jgi:6-phosphofructokinase 2
LGIDDPPVRLKGPPMEQKTIVTFTINPSIGTSVRVEQVIPERKLRCRVPRSEPGGGGINVSRAVKILGGRSTAVFTAGGAFGALLESLLDQEGIVSLPVPISRSTRENFTVHEETSGQQFRFGMPGPRLENGEWKKCLEVVLSMAPKPDYLVASGSLPPGVPPDFFAHIAVRARKRGTRLIVDTSGEPLLHAAKAGVFLLKPNLRELGVLSGGKIENESQAEALAGKWAREGCCEGVLVSMGAGGALLVSPQGAERMQAPTVPIESKVGAGDSMVAGTVLALARGRSLTEAARFGVAAGAAAVMTPGTELCRREDAKRLYLEMGSRKSNQPEGIRS